MTGDNKPTTVIPFDDEPIGPPPKLSGAPDYMQGISDRLHAMEMRQQTDRHRLSNAMMTMQGAVSQDIGELRGEVGVLAEKLGQEPDAKGYNGKGLIGDLRETTDKVQQLLDLKAKGIGAIAAITLFGALILLGVAHWVQQITAASK